MRKNTCCLPLNAALPCKPGRIAKLTGISIRTLQYYDEIGLLPPSELTSSGYRLYDNDALQTLQQILFFKELGFQLKEISELLKKPDFDRSAAFKNQKELFLLKRNRINRLIQLLERLEKGEQCMSFKEFDLSDYINALEEFKSNNSGEIMKHWGSVEKYTEAMKYNLEHFSEIVQTQLTEEAKEINEQFEILYAKLTANLSKEVVSPEIQSIVQEIILLIQKNGGDVSLEQSYIDILIDSYSDDYVKNITDTKYGEGASDYIVKAFRYYEDNIRSQDN